MPNYRRLYVPGGTYAFTLCLHDRRADTLVRYIDDLRASYRDVTARHPARTIAICVLPDHVHLLWALPDGDCDFVNRLRLIKAGFTRRLPPHLKSVGRKGERRIWQSRYWEHVIRGENDLAAHMDYIHWNPVKHGLVTAPEAWPHSSWHRYKDNWNREWKPESSSPSRRAGCNPANVTGGFSGGISVAGFHPALRHCYAIASPHPQR